MLSKEHLDELLEEFPELKSSDLILQKEVFAHFGLLFMALGILEHGLINAAMLLGAANDFSKSEIKTVQKWADLIDVQFENATKLTFGNLVKRLVKNSSFKLLEEELLEAKSIRNYFAHHFMRNESDLFSAPAAASPARAPTC